MNGHTEDHLIEQPTHQFMQHELGWEVANCYEEWSSWSVSNQEESDERRT